MINLDKHNYIKYIKKAQLWLGFFILIFFISGCHSREKTISISGHTMGTTYSIIVVNNGEKSIEKVSLKSKIESAEKKVAEIKLNVSKPKVITTCINSK